MIDFSKMSGAGNDFIVIDNRELKLDGDLSGMIRNLCARRTAVGADGLILLNKAAEADLDFRMRYFNADGGEAEMCGNGGRCVALFAFLLGAAGREMTFGTGAGTYRAEILDSGMVRLDMTAPKDIEPSLSLELKDGKTAAAFANTGVPHVVLEVPDLETVPVVNRGREIRNHGRFQPAGTNVNFVHVSDRDSMEVRTYERGVEDETLACGTGVTAAAILLHLHDKINLPVQVRTRGGDVLIVYGNKTGDTVTAVQLEGPAVLTYKGYFDSEMYR